MPRANSSRFPKREECGKCAGFHTGAFCPAKFRQCIKCKKYGHYSRCCQTPDLDNHNNSLNKEVKAINQVKFEQENTIKNISNEEEYRTNFLNKFTLFVFV